MGRGVRSRARAARLPRQTWGGQGGETVTVSDFLGEKVGQKTQKQGGVDLTEVCKIRFLMAGTQRF